MDKKLYELMDWAEIETIVYSEHDHPEQVLGVHRLQNDILVQVFLPDARNVFLKNKKDGKLYQMEQADEAGFFAVLLPGRKIPPYELIARYEDGSERMGKDPYAYADMVQDEWTELVRQGREMSYQRLGAHVVKVVGEGQDATVFWEAPVRRKKGETVCTGTFFSVCVPYAMRVSVVGDFNHWDGRVHPMIRQGNSDIFALFIPGLDCGELYKFEVKWNARELELQSDPYAFCCEMPPGDASIIADTARYEWNDRTWMANRKKFQYERAPMSVYEVYLGSWKRKTAQKKEAAQEPEKNRHWNYREIVPELAKYMEEMGYTHVELLPIMEYDSEVSLGYETTGYFAPTARYGSPEDFMYLVDYLHQRNIGVLLDWVAVYKYRREGADAVPFLVENALYWKDCFHVDGLRVTGMESIVRLDYGRSEGEWIPNSCGGNEDFSGISFLQTLSKKFHAAGDGAILISEDASAYPKVTESIENGGLGFDLKWNGGWAGDFLEYMEIDPLFRKGKHNNLLNGMLYAYSERFVLALSHNHVMNGKNTLLMKMPGEMAQKFGNIRVALGYMMTFPGKKLLFMGQEFAGCTEWDGIADLSWDELDEKEHLGIQNYVKQWNHFYQAHPALFELDYCEQGFEWISSMDADHSIIAFLRRSQGSREELLIVCNFTPVLYENFRVGVPYEGTYREIFNSDSTSFGGTGFLNNRAVASRKVGWDGRENSICINVPPLGVSVFHCVPVKEEEE